MASEAFIKGMMNEARKQYFKLSWFNFIRKLQYQGAYNACKLILEEKE